MSISNYSSILHRYISGADVCLCIDSMYECKKCKGEESAQQEEVTGKQNVNNCKWVEYQFGRFKQEAAPKKLLLDKASELMEEWYLYHSSKAIYHGASHELQDHTPTDARWQVNIPSLLVKFIQSRLGEDIAMIRSELGLLWQEQLMETVREATESVVNEDNFETIGRDPDTWKGVMSKISCRSGNNGKRKVMEREHKEIMKECIANIVKVRLPVVCMDVCRLGEDYMYRTMVADQSLDDLLAQVSRGMGWQAFPIDGEIHESLMKRWDRFQNEQMTESMRAYFHKVGSGDPIRSDCLTEVLCWMGWEQLNSKQQSCFDALYNTEVSSQERKRRAQKLSRREEMTLVFKAVDTILPLMNHNYIEEGGTMVNMFQDHFQVFVAATLGLSHQPGTIQLTRRQLQFMQSRVAYWFRRGSRDVVPVPV